MSGVTWCFDRDWAEFCLIELWGCLVACGMWLSESRISDPRLIKALSILGTMVFYLDLPSTSYLPTAYLVAGESSYPICLISCSFESLITLPSSMILASTAINLEPCVCLNAPWFTLYPGWKVFWPTFVSTIVDRRTWLLCSTIFSCWELVIDWISSFFGVKSRGDFVYWASLNDLWEFSIFYWVCFHKPYIFSLENLSCDFGDMTTLAFGDFTILIFGVIGFGKVIDSSFSKLRA